METAAMQEEKAMLLSDIGGPKSCREKFLRAWNEKLKLQLRPTLSSQMPERQSAIHTPNQEKWTKDKSLSHLLKRASGQPSENAIYYLMVMPASEAQLHTSPASCWTTGHCPQQLPTGLDPVDKKLASNPLDLETNPEEEFLQICVSDLLLESSMKKRPRLLPPNRKMHVEVLWKKQELHLRQEYERSPVPLQYNHLIDTMALTNPDDLTEVESFYRRFTPGLKQPGSCRSTRPFHPQVECHSPPSTTEASTCQQGARRTAKMRYKLHRQLSLKRSAPLADLTMATKQSLNTSQNGHLPPKKRYTQGCLKEMCCNIGNVLGTGSTQA
ncbi:uncharacterized protein LOC133382149 isoform X2 [Rhineura floridana]|nr:uncharacterized protein LOC133382149 isoform X2 [Rhineura floridana]XP_061477802.1 uncharacterized protein LOC133382149 isoform X2 [Rhineura floridana]XP_061477803.1 uncharacterized protein LOC133382149 isoform X2 [Rhineura floridana]XP_061477805.1 uncharacterized protein LOC133382149 isoform X2 [Rhineura floridana]